VIAELRPEAVQDSPETATRLGAKLRHDIKAIIGVTAAVEIAPVGRIERSLGKAKRVIDLRPKD
ncbi:MAG: phenylacetate--CoA ligase, partial [Streptosporangiaceae bacterium]